VKLIINPFLWIEIQTS